MKKEKEKSFLTFCRESQCVLRLLLNANLWYELYISPGQSWSFIRSLQWNWACPLPTAWLSPCLLWCCHGRPAHLLSKQSDSPLPPVMKSAPTEGCRPPSQLVCLQDLHSGRGLVGRSVQKYWILPPTSSIEYFLLLTSKIYFLSCEIDTLDIRHIFL